MNIFLGWNELALACVAIAYLFAVLVYMLSYIITSELMRAWARSEMQNIIFTLILFATLSTLAALPFISGDKNTKGYVYEGKEYLGVLYNDSTACITNSMRDANALAVLGSTSISISSLIFGLQSPTYKDSSGQIVKYTYPGDITSMGSMGVSLAPFISPITTMVSNVQQYSMIPIGMIKLHLLLIDFIIRNGTSILLPVGIAMRAFKFSRNAGNMIIALFIALYFVLPAAYLFNRGLLQEVTGDYKAELCSDPLDSPSLLGEMVAMLTQNWGFDPSKMLDRSITVNIEEIVPEKLTFGGSGLSKLALRVGIEGFLLPFFSIILTLGIAREFAASLGSDVDFSQLVRVV
ncbi:MAG: hypothetical protein N3H30_01010 [Candidatus Micrarchaeota archaeon]|nr:hypothetical protein [Candidatus Micrarchaeota archaeon]